MADELNIVLKTTADTSYIPQQIKQVENEINSSGGIQVKISTNTVSSDADAYYNTVKKSFESAYAELNHLRDTDKIDASQYYKELKNLNDSTWKDLGKTREDAQKNWLKYDSEQYKGTKRLEAGLKDANDALKNLDDSWTGSLVKFLKWQVIGDIIHTVKDSIMQMVEEVKNLDAALTEFKKVSDMSTQQLESFVNKSYDLGETVAKTGTEVVEAATNFKKMGYTANESLDLAKDALMWTNVADGMVTASDAATMIISNLKAFSAEGLTSTHVIDALNEVSNNYAVSSSDLSNNLSRVATVMAQSNTSFEETIGLMTAGVELMPGMGGKVANGLKTISQRLRGVSEDGESLSGYVAKLDSAFSQFGFTVSGSNGELRSTYSILKDLAKAYPNMTDEQRQYVGELVAGKNQITVLESVLSNFNTAIEATNSAINSNGSALKENKNVLNSIQGKLQQLSSSFSKLANNTINKDLIKSLIDVTTLFVKLTDKTNLITAAIGFLITKLLILKFDTIIVGAKELISTFAQLREKLLLTISSFNDARASGLSFSDSLKFAGISANAYAAAVSALIIVISAAKSAHDDYIKKIEEQRQADIDAGDEAYDRSLKINELYNNINNLSEKEKELASSSEESAKRQAEFKDIVEKSNSIVAKTPGLMEASKKGVNEYKIALDNATKSQKEFLLGESQIALQSAKSNVEDLVTFFKTPETDFTNIISDLIPDTLDEDTKKKINNFISQYGQYSSQSITQLPKLSIISPDGVDELVQFYLQASSIIDDLKEKIGQLSVDPQNAEEVKNLIEEEKAFEDILGQISPEVETYIKSLYNYQMTLASLNGTLPTSKEGIEDFAKSMSESMGVGEDYIDTLEQWIEKDLGFQDAIEEVKTLSEKVQEAQGEISNATSAWTSITEKSELLSQAQKELNSTTGLTASTFNSLINTGMIAFLENVDGQTRINTDAFNNYADATKQEALAALQAGASLDIEAVASGNVQNASELAKTAIAGLASQNSATQITVENLTTANKNLAKSELEKAAAAGASAQELSKRTAQLNAVVAAYNNAAISISGMSIGSNTSNKTDNNYGSGSSSSEDTTDYWKKEFEEKSAYLKHQLEMDYITEEDYYNQLEGLYKHYFSDLSKYQDEYWKYEEEVYQYRKKAAEEYYDNLNDLLDDVNDKIQDVYDEAEERHQEYIDSLQASIDDMEATIDWVSSVIDKEIDALEDEKTALENNNDERERAIKLQNLEANLAKAKAKKVMVYKSGIGFTYEQDYQAVSDAQKELDEYRNEQSHRDELSRIDEQINALKKYKQAWKDVVTNYKNEQNKLIAAQILGEASEEDILQQREDILTDFNTNYTVLMRQLAEAINQNVDSYITEYEDLYDELQKLVKLQEQYNALLREYYYLTSVVVTEPGTNTPTPGTETPGTEPPAKRYKPTSNYIMINSTPELNPQKWVNTSMAQSIGGQTSYGSWEVYSANGLIGWTNSDWITEYAKGTLASKSGIAKVNEEGIEAIVTPNGTITSLPDSGYGVIPNKETETLTNFAQDPLSFLSSLSKLPSVTPIDNNRYGGDNIYNVYGSIAVNANDANEFFLSIKNAAIQRTTNRK